LLEMKLIFKFHRREIIYKLLGYEIKEDVRFNDIESFYILDLFFSSLLKSVN